MKKALQLMLACTLVLQPLIPAIPVFAVTEETSELMIEAENYINLNDASLEDVVGPRQYVLDAPIESEELDETEQPPEDEQGGVMEYVDLTPYLGLDDTKDVLVQRGQARANSVTLSTRSFGPGVGNLDDHANRMSIRISRVINGRTYFVENNGFFEIRRSNPTRHVFCLEPWVMDIGQTNGNISAFNTSLSLRGNTNASAGPNLALSWRFSPSITQLDRVTLIIHYGWNTVPRTNRAYVLTQMLIWEALGWTIGPWQANAGQELGTRFNATIRAEMDAILARVDAHWTVPNFTNWPGEVNIGDRISITDANRVLQNGFVPDFNATNGTRGLDDIRINGNTLTATITATNARLRLVRTSPHARNNGQVFSSGSGNNRTQQVVDFIQGHDPVFSPTRAFTVRQNHTITVEHRVVGTNELLLREPGVQVRHGDPFVTNPRPGGFTHGGFIVLPTGGSQTINSVTQNQTLIHWYNFQVRSVRVDHRNARDNNLVQTANGQANSYNLSGTWRDGDTIRSGDAPSRTFTRVMPNGDVRNWRHVQAPNFNITVHGNMILTHLYRRPQQLTVNHINDRNTAERLGQNITTTHHDTDSYTTTARIFNRTMPDGTSRAWRLQETPANATGVFNNADVTVTYRYRRPQQLTSHYVNHRTGAALRTPIVDNTRFDGETFSSAVLTFQRTMPDGTVRNWRHNTSTSTPTGSLNAARTAVTGTFNAQDVVATHRYDRPVQITVEHIDVETGNIITTDIDNGHWSGDVATICPREDLVTSEGNVYIPDNHECRVITLTDEDVTVRINYIIPTLGINVDEVIITTGISEMPTELRLSRDLLHSQYLGAIRYRVRLTNLDTGVITETPERSWVDFQTRETVNLPTNNMTPGESANIRIDVVFTHNPSPNRLETDSVNLRTWGYRSSERILTNEDFNGYELSYTAVEQTIGTRTNTTLNVRELNETFTLTAPELVDLITGRGFRFDVPTTYSSEIGTRGEHELTLLPDSRLVDGDLPEYQREGALTRIELTQTEGNYNDGLWKLPEVFARRSLEGTVIGREDFDRLSPAERANYHQGGRQILTPIWDTDLGTYALSLETSRIGINEFSVIWEDSVTLFAFLFNWENEYGPSPTHQLDQVVVSPIHATDRNNDGMIDIWDNGSHPDNWGVNQGGRQVLTAVEREFLGLE